MLFRDVLELEKGSRRAGPLRRAMTFRIEETALDLAADLLETSGTLNSEQAVRDLRPPHDAVWLEFGATPAYTRVASVMRGEQREHRPSKLSEFGFLFLRDPGLNAIDITAYHRYDGSVVRPIMGCRAYPTEDKFEAFILEDEVAALLKDQERRGLPDHISRQHIREYGDFSASLAKGGLTIGSILFSLLSAKDAPVERISEAPSRQERRALIRKGVDPDEAGKGHVRIALNREGEQHMRVVRGDGMGSDIRAHWVRGHLMWTATKGYVWRRSHVRGGSGEAEMTPRIVV